MEMLLIFLASGAYFVFALLRLELAVVGLSVFFPLYLIKGSVSGAPITLIEGLILVTALAYFLRWMKETFSPKRRFSSLFSSIKETLLPRESFIHRYKYLSIGVGLLVTAAFFSLLITPKELILLDGQIFPGMRTALGILKSWIIVPVIYLFLLLSTIRTTKQGLDVLNGYTLSAILLGLFALYQVITQNYITPDARASGPFENANYLALYVGPALLYGMVRLREAFTHKKDLPVTSLSLFFVGTGVLLLALLASKSYAGLLALFIAAAFYFGLEYWNKRATKSFPWKFVIGGVGVITLTLVIIFLIDPSKWQAMFQFAERNSSSVRIEVYAIAWGLLTDNWLMGIGMGQFPALYQIEAVNILGHQPFEWNMLHPHNLFLAMWLNLGLLGLLAFVGILSVALQKASLHFQTFAQEKVIGVGKVRVIAFSLLLIIFAHGFFDTPFFKNDLSLLFWMILGILMAVKEDH